MNKMDCSKCKWSNPETCRICRAEQEENTSQKIHNVVAQIVQTRQAELEPMETDPNWWKLHLMFHNN